MLTVQAIGVGAAAKLLALGGAVIGLTAGVLYSFGGAIYDALVTSGWVTSTSTPGLSFGTVLAFGALVGMPLIGSVLGCVSGAFGAWTYNSVAKRVGGLEIQLSGPGSGDSGD